MVSMYRFFLVVVFFSETLNASSFDHRSDIYDFFVQDVCEDQNGNIDTSKLPHECETRRNMRVTDNFYYRTHARFDDTRAQFIYGNDAWSSYPVVENQKRRILLMKDNGKVNSNVSGSDEFGVFDDNDGISLRWMGSSTNSYGFLLFTASPQQAGFGITSQNCHRPLNSVTRYYDNWIHGPKNTDSLALEVPWGVTTQVDLILSINDGMENPIPSQCDLNYKYAFHFSVRTMGFKFTNNKKMETIVHQKFSPGDSMNQGPTTAKTFERIYMTREYGITRWEKWQREDHPNFNLAKSRKMLKSMTSQAARGERICTRPYNIAMSPAGMNFVTGAYSKNSDGYFENYRDLSTGEGSKKWYLIECVDVSGKILTGEDLKQAYRYDDFGDTRIQSKPQVQGLLEEVSDPSHNLFDLFF